MYRVIFQQNNGRTRTIAQHLSDMEHCELAIMRFCDNSNYNIPHIDTWYDDEKHIVYDVGIRSHFFLCEEEEE